MAGGNERCAKVLTKDTVDKRNIGRKGRPCIARWRERHLAGCRTTGSTGLCKDRCVTLVAPAQQDPAKIGGAHSHICSRLWDKMISAVSSRSGKILYLPVTADGLDNIDRFDMYVLPL